MNFQTYCVSPARYQIALLQTEKPTLILPTYIQLVPPESTDIIIHAANMTINTLTLKPLT